MPDTKTGESKFREDLSFLSDKDYQKVLQIIKDGLTQVTYGHSAPIWNMNDFF